MRILVSIDDTDQIKTEDLVEVISTGKLAGKLAAALEEKGWGKCEPVTRHQLLVHPDVPYTSHNSSMCFAADINPDNLDDIINYGGEFLKKEQAPGADPGLCVAVIDRLTKPGWLISFGYSAKNEVLTKDDAYGLAAELGIYLSEHGGTGDGVIGALAGAGLRLGGNDGRFRGKFNIKAENDIVTAKEIKAQTFIDIVRSIDDGKILDDEEHVLLGDTVKPVLLYGKAVLLVYPLEKSPGNVKWQTCSKPQLKGY
ncbi:hypothetical protein [Syntrophomonas palmitatica]|uniref:hypothetical protein n=1 Tax=Syntrophomonas palmitatica TaxID=402877 RepID=UPI0006D0B9E2|nr:hypothetical protein [Syntrophomonas palmitatica]